jgi:hypothetical protein
LAGSTAVARDSGSGCVIGSDSDTLMDKQTEAKAEHFPSLSAR